MKTSTTRILAAIRQWCFFVALLGLQSTNFVLAQDINTTSLTEDYWYRRDASPSLPMHNQTSKSVVMIKAAPRPDLPNPGQGTAYFIQTQEDLPYYCLLTAAHNLYSGERLTKSDDIIGLNMSFRVTYLNPTANPATYSYNGFFASRPISASVAYATIVDHRDFAVLKIPKWIVVGTGINLHGIDTGVPNLLPAERLSEVPMQSLYTIHHAGLRPQLLSTLRRSDYVLPRTNPADFTRPKDYSEAWGLPNMAGTDPGTSGSPLVLPGANSDFNDAPAIGIYVIGAERHVSNSQTVRDNVFYRLSNPEIKDVIKSACFGMKDGGEDPSTAYVKSRIPAPIAESVSVILPILKKIKTDISEVHDATVAEEVMLPIGQMAKIDQEGIEITQKIDELIRLFEDKNINEVQLLKVYNDLDKIEEKYIPDLGQVTSAEHSPGPPPGYYKDMHSIFSSFGNASVSSAEEALKKKVPHCIQWLATDLSIAMKEVGKYFGHEAVTARVKKAAASTYMRAPDELADLRNSMIDLTETINNRYKKLTEYKSAHIDFFQGLELFYKDQDEYSNLFLLEHFYQDEYLLMDFGITKLEEDLKKAQNFSSLRQFSTNFATKLATIKEQLAKLKAKNYPAGFLTFPAQQPTVAYDYFHFLNDNKKFTIKSKTSPSLITWQDLDLRYEEKANSFNYKDILAGPTIDRIDRPSGLDVDDGKTVTQELLSAYSTKLKLWGSVDVDNIKPTLHPYLKQFLQQSGLSLKKMGSFAKVKPNSKQTITHTFVFDRDKLPRSIRNAYTTRITDFIKTQTETPKLELSANASSKVVRFELNSPEILVLSRAFRKVEDPKGSNKGYITNERNDANDYLGQNFISMINYAANALTLKYHVEINNKIGWDNNLDLAAPMPPIVPGRYRIQSRWNSQYLQTVEPSVNHRRYNDLPWVENLAPYQANLPEQIVKVELNPDGQTYSLTHEGSRVGQYLGRAGYYYTQFINGVASGFMIGYSASKEGSEQKWTLSPSSTDGYFQIVNTNAVGDVVNMTAEYDPDYQAMMVHLYNPQNKPEQDWRFNPVINGARMAAAPSAEPGWNESRGIPTLYPNPVSDHLTVTLPEGYEQSESIISNIRGTILNPPVRKKGSNLEVDVRSLPTGMYFIQIQAEGQPKQVLKFLKQ